MKKTTFNVSQMDCPSEEQLIRMKLEQLEDIFSLEFDIPKRELIVYHKLDDALILNELEKLKLGTKIILTEEVNDIKKESNQLVQKKTLIIVLLINFTFFIVEIITGFISNSMGLVADSLDMLADSIVYALALFAVGATIIIKKKIAKFAGIFQIILATIGIAEVIRRFLGNEKLPDFQTMIVVSIFALIANIICLYLLQKAKSKEAHMQASMIFTSNDIIINSGVILAGVLVLLLNSALPDLIIGSLVFLVVLRGAFRILKISK